MDTFLKGILCLAAVFALLSPACETKAQYIQDDSSTNPVNYDYSDISIAVGATYSGNVLGIYGNATVTSSGAVNVGSYSGSVGNVISIADSIFQSSNSFTIGTESGSDGNTVNIINSIGAFNGLFRIGYKGSNNAVNIYNSTVSFTGTGHFCISGHSGAYNKAVIYNSIMTTPRLFVGGMAGQNTLTNHNSAIVNGTSSITISGNLNVGIYDAGGTGSSQVIDGNSFSIFPGSTVNVTNAASAAVRVGNYTGMVNQIRIAKSTSTSSGVLTWSGNHTATGDDAIGTLIGNGAFAYSDNNGGSWTTTTSAGSFAINYDGVKTTVSRP